MAAIDTELPASIDATLYDLGRLTALWVSAFEILAHPGNGKSGMNTVYPLLESTPYLNSRLRRKMYLTYKPKNEKQLPERRALPCWLYKKLYDARNAFLHGNRVRISLLSPPKYKIGLFWLAPCLYRLALTGFVDLTFGKKIPSLAEPEKLGEYIGQEYSFQRYQQTIESALLKARH